MSQLLSCPFCSEKLHSSKLLSEHFMLCGNKTSLCPNCKKYIRRAIFAYHYENNCADIDELTDVNQSDSKLLSTTVNISQEQEKSRITQDKTIVQCTFCEADCEQKYISIHHEKCLSNPNNIKKKQQKKEQVQSNRNSSQTNSHNGLYNQVHSSPMLSTEAEVEHVTYEIKALHLCTRYRFCFPLGELRQHKTTCTGYHQQNYSYADIVKGTHYASHRY